MYLFSLAFEYIHHTTVINHFIHLLLKELVSWFQVSWLSYPSNLSLSGEHFTSHYLWIA